MTPNWIESANGSNPWTQVNPPALFKHPLNFFKLQQSGDSILVLTTSISSIPHPLPTWLFIFLIKRKPSIVPFSFECHPGIHGVNLNLQFERNSPKETLFGHFWNNGFWYIHHYSGQDFSLGQANQSILSRRAKSQTASRCVLHRPRVSKVENLTIKEKRVTPSERI